MVNTNIANFAEYQCDAREAGLARVFEMEDRWFRLGDHGRYAPERPSFNSLAK